MKERAWIVKEYCRLVNENIYFIKTYFEGIVPAGRPENEIYWRTKATGEQLRVLWEKEAGNESKLQGKKVNFAYVGNGNRAEAEINRILGEYLNYATEYLEKGEPWNTIEQDRKACRNTVLNSLQMIANLAVWLAILGEYPANSVLKWLELEAAWKVQSVHSGVELSKAEELVLPVISCGA